MSIHRCICPYICMYDEYFFPFLALLIMFCMFVKQKKTTIENKISPLRYNLIFISMPHKLQVQRHSDEGEQECKISLDGAKLD